MLLIKYLKMMEVNIGVMLEVEDEVVEEDEVAVEDEVEEKGGRGNANKRGEGEDGAGGGRGQGDGGEGEAAAQAVAGGRGTRQQHGAGQERMSGRVSAQGRAVCARMQRCRAFVDALKLDAVFLDGAHDRCYCVSCAAHIPDVLEQGSAHGHKYEVPKGWCGFGLHLPPRYAGSMEMRAAGAWLLQRRMVR